MFAIEVVRFVFAHTAAPLCNVSTWPLVPEVLYVNTAPVCDEIDVISTLVPLGGAVENVITFPVMEYVDFCWSIPSILTNV